MWETCMLKCLVLQSLTSGESRFPWRNLSSSSTLCFSKESFSWRRLEISCRISWESWALLLRSRPFRSLNSCSRVSMRPVRVTRSLLSACRDGWSQWKRIIIIISLRSTLLKLCSFPVWIPDWNGASWSPDHCAPVTGLLSWPGFPLFSWARLPDLRALVSGPVHAPFPHPAIVSAPLFSAQTRRGIAATVSFHQKRMEV